MSNVKIPFSFYEELDKVILGCTNKFILSQSTLNQFYHVGGVLEFSGQADFKTVPRFATFEGDIEGNTAKGPVGHHCI